MVSGAAAGAVAGIFGAGGGLVLVPLLTVCTDLPEEALFGASLAIILPICAVSLVSAAWIYPIPWEQSVPYMLGSAVGGCLAGFWGNRIPTAWLHRVLGLLILWGGWRYLC